MRITQLIRNANNPRDFFWGRLMITKMNFFHRNLSLWGLSHIQVPPHAITLDLGCGGGKNVQRLHRLSRGGKAFGVDLSKLSLRHAVRHNMHSVLNGETAIIHAGADDLPFKDGYFDVVTAFETIYYWPNLARCFREIHRVLRPGGTFMICNEDTFHEDRPEEHEAIQSILDIHFYSNDELSKLLLQAGFRKVSYRTHKNGQWVVLVAHV